MVMDLQPPFRKIIHVDMDAFYASVAVLDNPELKGKAIAVGSSSDRGVISAASYEARKYGVKSAMSSYVAKQKCPHLIFVKSDFPRYREISKQVRNIFYEYTNLVEPLSLDEAYLDVTENKKNNPSASLIAKEIRAQIFKETGLRASAGISINKFIAKVASDFNKPNGQKTVNPHEVLQFLEDLPIHKFYGIGKVTAAKMNNMGVFSGKDLKKRTLEELATLFGKAGVHYYNIVRGIHNSPVKPNRIRKSIGAERTFLENMTSEIEMLEKLKTIAIEIEKRMKNNNVKGKTVTLKIKYSDFTLQTRSKTVHLFLQNKTEIFSVVKELLFQEKVKNSVRLLGISISNLNTVVKKPIWIQLKFNFSS